MKIRKFLTLTAAICAAFFLVLHPISGGAGKEAIAAHVSAAAGSSKAFDYSKIPAWDGVPYYRLNQGSRASGRIFFQRRSAAQSAW